MTVTEEMLVAGEKAAAPPKIEPKAKVLGPIKASRLHFGKLKQISASYRPLFADIPSGVAFETTLNPDFWAHHIREIRPLDTIEMFCEDGTWEAKCRVMSVGQAEVHLSKISYVEHADIKGEALSETFVLAFKGPVLKWCVVRSDDGTIIAEKFFPKSEAQTYLANHLKGTGT